MKKIVFGCPIRDRSYSLSTYLDYVTTQDYPHELITLFFVLNDCRPAEERAIIECLQCFKEDTNFADIVWQTKNFGHPEDRRGLREELDAYQSMSIIRNHYLSQLDQFEYDYFFSCDSDVLLLDPRTISKLVDRQKDLVGVPVNNQTGTHDYPEAMPNILVKSEFEKNGEPIYFHWTNYPLDSVFQVGATGAACLMTQKVTEICRYNLHFQGEDLGFALDMERHGFSQWVDSTIETYHAMQPYLMIEFQEQQVLKCSDQQSK